MIAKRKRRQRVKTRRRAAKRRTTVRRRKAALPSPLPVETAPTVAALPPPATETEEPPGEFPPGWHRLTPMQQRVLRLVATGRTTNAIAAELGASPHTVQAHRVHIAVRLGLRGRTALQEFVFEHRARLLG